MPLRFHPSTIERLPACEQARVLQDEELAFLSDRDGDERQAENATVEHIYREGWHRGRIHAHREYQEFSASRGRSSSGAAIVGFMVGAIAASAIGSGVGSFLYLHHRVSTLTAGENAQSTADITLEGLVQTAPVVTETGEQQREVLTSDRPQSNLEPEALLLGTDFLTQLPTIDVGDVSDRLGDRPFTELSAESNQPAGLQLSAE